MLFKVIYPEIRASEIGSIKKYSVIADEERCLRKRQNVYLQYTLY